MPSRIGVVVEALTDPIQQRAGVDHGVRVVEASGPAAEAGIREGDIITRLNNQEIDSPATFSKVVDSLTSGSFGAGADRAWNGADVPRVARPFRIAGTALRAACRLGRGAWQRFAQMGYTPRRR